MLARAKVVGEEERGFNLFLPCVHHKAEVERAAKSGRSLLVEIPDPRRVSREQQMKAHVLIGYIADWYGGTPQEVMKVILKEIFGGQVPSLAEDEFSLADCSMERARMFITWLVDFCLLYGIDTGVPMYELADDVPKYVWACAMNHRCAVCGKHAELHHVDAVGSGRNRKEICHMGMRALPLCRAHHTEIHRIGRESFLKHYFLVPVEIDERIAQEYKLYRKVKSNE